MGPLIIRISSRVIRQEAKEKQGNEEGHDGVDEDL